MKTGVIVLMTLRKITGLITRPHLFKLVKGNFNNLSTFYW